ncbi:hypothetical protein HYC85_028499 [Camellia sinensis]|uniref:Uncharacterized protein n=1 Tax=Camellia sinensis TaxID=4442 RepID=A0A7J7FXI9_CAMSI|nr:hypothetical protein HYC85_028499 [Camellia sinensis]
MHGHPVQISNRLERMTCRCLWIRKIARTVVGCLIASLHSIVSTQWRTFTLMWNRLQRLYTLCHQQFTLITHLRVVRRNTNFQPPKISNQKKGQSEGASLLASSMENLTSLVKSQQCEV